MEPECSSHALINLACATEVNKRQGYCINNRSRGGAFMSILAEIELSYGKDAHDE